MAIARPLGDGRRQRTHPFSAPVSHYIFENRFGRPGKGNDKGKSKVENLVGFARQNFLVPMPQAREFDELNTKQVACCQRRFGDCLHGHQATIGEWLSKDLDQVFALGR